MPEQPSNEEIANVFTRVADLLEGDEL